MNEHDGECDHDWELIDNSFDHEYGCEQIQFWTCSLCDETRDIVAIED